MVTLYEVTLGLDRALDEAALTVRYAFVELVEARGLRACLVERRDLRQRLRGLDGVDCNESNVDLFRSLIAWAQRLNLHSGNVISRNVTLLIMLRA